MDNALIRKLETKDADITQSPAKMGFNFCTKLPFILKPGRPVKLSINGLSGMFTQANYVAKNDT